MSTGLPWSSRLPPVLAAQRRGAQGQELELCRTGVRRSRGHAAVRFVAARRGRGLDHEGAKNAKDAKGRDLPTDAADM